MENRNLTIVFTKGGINELRKQLDAVSTYCFNNNLFIEKIIVTNNKYYKKSFLKLLAILQFRKIKTHIAVAGGKNKIESIIATEFNDVNGVLVTDEGAAYGIINKLKLEHNLN